MERPDWTERIPENWRPLLTTRAAVLLVYLIAVLSIATGLVNIGEDEVIGPLAAFIPPAVQATVGFTGTLTGFVMLGGAEALRRGLRAGWWATVLLLPMTAIQGILQSSPYSIPLIVLSILAMPTLLATRRRFDRSASLTTGQMAAGLALVAVQLYGTLGTWALRDNYEGVETLLDAFYYTIVTASTVGYGDISPETQGTRLFSISIVVFGVASFGVAVGALVGPAIQARLTRTLGKMTDTQLKLLDDHVLVLGYGDLTESILEALDDAGVPVAVVTSDRETASALNERDVPVLSADPSDEEPLRRAGIAEARAVLVATNRDAEDALAILTARQLRPSIPIVAAATDRENVGKLERAGASTVLSPADLGGKMLVRSALGGDGDRAVEQFLAAFDDED